TGAVPLDFGTCFAPNMNEAGSAGSTDPLTNYVVETGTSEAASGEQGDGVCDFGVLGPLFGAQPGWPAPPVQGSLGYVGESDIEAAWQAGASLSLYEAAALVASQTVTFLFPVWQASVAGRPTSSNADRSPSSRLSPFLRP